MTQNVNDFGDSAAPRLGKPGAGLPWFEAFVARHVLMRFGPRKTSWDVSNQRFLKEGNRILEMFRRYDPIRNPVHEKLLETPQLIDRIPGIEDSSRHWSVTMTMEHLMIVGRHMTHIIHELGMGRAPGLRVDVAQVKPLGSLRAQEAYAQFEEFCHKAHERISDPALDREITRVKQHHPWFGDITAHQWNFLLSMHQTIHRKQIEGILKQCENGH